MGKMTHTDEKKKAVQAIRNSSLQYLPMSSSVMQRSGVVDVLWRNMLCTIPGEKGSSDAEYTVGRHATLASEAFEKASVTCTEVDRMDAYIFG